MLFYIIFGLIMLVLITKALINTAYGVALMVWAICLFVVGYTLKLLAFFLRIYEFLQGRSQSKKVCSPQFRGSVKIHAKQNFSKVPSNRIQNKSFHKCLPTGC